MLSWIDRYFPPVARACICIFLTVPLMLLVIGLIDNVMSSMAGTLFGVVATAILLYRLVPQALARMQRDWGADVLSQNPYGILGVAQSADVQAIRRAYRKLMRRHHPDVVPEAQRAQASEMVNRISEAFEILSDEDKRWHYDGLIRDGEIPPLEEALEIVRRLGPLSWDRETDDFHTTELLRKADELAAADNAEFASADQTECREDDCVTAQSSVKPVELEIPEAQSSVEPVELEIPESIRDILATPPRPSLDSKSPQDLDRNKSSPDT